MYKSKLLARSVASIMGASCLGGVGAVYAESTSLLEEVVVTAQKREENLNEVPVAVTLLTSDQIDSSFANNVNDLQQRIPSVSFREGNTTRNSALTVRGIGTISFSIGAEPSVSTVVDGVVLGRSGQAFGDLYDLERVELLRGPQGTLFGKNASAGVLNITTKRPSAEFEGYIDTSFYQDNERIIKGRISGPISDRVRGSLTVVDSEFDGYIENVYNNETVNGYDKQGVRGMLDIEIDDTSNMLFIYEDYSSDSNCCVDLVARPVNDSRPQDPDAAPQGTGLDLEQRKTDTDFETRTLDSTTAFSIQYEKALGEYDLTSITAQRTWNNTEFREGDFTSVNGDIPQVVDFSTVGFQLHDIGPQEWRQLSQELRISSPTGNAHEWQAGVFYWNITSERNFTRFASCQDGDNRFNDAISTYLGNTLGAPNSDADVAAFIDENDLTCLATDIVDATAYMQTEFDNLGVFGQGTYHFTDAISLIYGLRYTHDEVSFKHRRINNDEYGRRGVGVRPRFSLGSNEGQLNWTDTDFEGSTGDHNISGKLGLQWQIADAHMIYGTYAQGYKGPAFNVFYNMDSDDLTPIDAETSDSLEFGYKLALDHLIANFAVYNTAISDFQANNFDTSSGVTTTSFTNGGDVNTFGYEVDFMWQVFENLQISGGAALSNAEASSGEADGSPLPFAPDRKASIAATYEVPLSSGAFWSYNLAGTYTDEQLSGNIGQTAETNPEIVLPSYKLLNGSISYTTSDENFKVSLIAKNLLDESYATTYSGDGFRYQIPRGADRYFGVNFRASF